MIDLSAAIAKLERHQVAATGSTIQPWSFRLISTYEGNKPICAHVFSAELVVTYVVPTDDGFVRVTEEMRVESDVSEATLRQQGLANLSKLAATKKFRLAGRRLILTGESGFEASLLLVDSLWDSDELQAVFPNGPIAAIGASDILVVCDRSDAEEIVNLRGSAEFVWGAGSSSGQLLSTDLYARHSGTWGVVRDQGATELPSLGTSIDGVVQPPLPEVVATASEPELPHRESLPSPHQEEPAGAAGQASTTQAQVVSNEPPGTSTEVRPPPKPNVSDAVRAASKLEREHAIGYGVAAALAAVLLATTLVSRHGAVIYQLVVFGSSTVGFGLAFLKRRKAITKHAVIDSPDVSVEPARRVVLATYGTASFFTAAAAFFSWHTVDDRTFSGFERGAGTFAFAFAFILALVAIGLLWDELEKPWDSALHVVALVCGSIFVIASFAGTAGWGMTRARTIVLLLGLLVIATATKVLLKAHADEVSRHRIRAALLSIAGASMLTAPFMSWGGGWIVNYAPGTQLGGIDGRLTVFAGASVLVASGVYFFGGAHHRDRWTIYIRVSTVLAMVGFYGVLSRGLANPHVGRTFAGAACGAVLLLALGSRGTASTTLPAGNIVAQRIAVGTMSLFMAALLTAAMSKLSSYLVLLGVSNDQDELLFAIVLGSVAFACARAVLGALREETLSVSSGGIVFLGLSMLLLFPVSNLTTRGLASSVIFLVVGVTAALSGRWVGGIPDLVPSRGIAKDSLRSNWKRAALVAAGVWAFRTWGLEHVVNFSEWPGGEATTVQFQAALRGLARDTALRTTFTVGIVAIGMARRRELVATILFSAGSGILFFEVSQEIAARLDFFDDTSWLIFGAVGAAYVGLFTLGRGAFSLVAVMVAVSAGAVAPQLLAVINMVLNLLNFPNGPRSDILVLHLPTALQLFFIALAFALFPVKKPSRPAPTPESITPPGEQLQTIGAVQ